MRRLLILVILNLTLLSLKSQSYGNEWINFSQQYYKLPIFKEGIYRLDSTTLANYYDLTTLNPKNLQVFIKGKEQFVYINGEADGKINTGDFVEFYARPFLGDVDSLLYTNITYVPNPYLSIYNDTLYAFITVNNSLSNKRYTLETDTNSAAYPQADHFYTEKVFTQFASYNDVTEYVGSSSDPHLTQAEGKGQLIAKGGVYASPASNLNTYTVAPLPFYISLNFSGKNITRTYSPDHQLRIYYTDQSNTPVLLTDTSFTGYAAIRKSYTLNSQNTNNNTAVTFSSVAAPSFSASSNTMLHYINYFYPHTTDLASQSFFKLWVDNSASSSKNFFKFSNFFYGASSSVLLLDITNGKRITTVLNGSQVRAVIPDASGGRKLCVMLAEKDTLNIHKLIKVEQSGSFTNYKKTLSSKPFVLIYHPSLKSSAMQYKAYRQSIAGGSYDVIDADIQALYEQFSYGINKHPLSIRNFIRYLKDSLSVPPAYVFLIGKGVDYMAFLTGNYQPINLIPTFGVPSSDHLYTAGLTATNTNLFYNEIPIGRLAALSNSEVGVYLDKVQTHESTGPADWKKQVLHFAGGDDDLLLSAISGYLSAYEDIIKDTLFGGHVTTFKKNTTAPIQTSISDSIRTFINRGASLITIFGHGSTNGFDQAIDDPNDYNNAGRYPFFMANSCFSGDIHTANGRSVSERFVVAKQKGSVGFVATTSYGFDYALHNFSMGFYQAFSSSHYGEAIGDIIKESVYQNSNGDLLTKLVGMDMTLSGDPAVRITNGNLPDYQIANENMAFDLKKYSDSIGVRLSWKNLGKAPKDSFAVKLQRIYPNGDSILILKNVRGTMYKDSLRIYLPIDFNKGIGLNKFSVKLDYYDRINESFENNNAIGPLDVFIPGGDVLPVFPYKYAIIPKTNSVILKASSSDPFAPTTTYRFQLDTCDKFTSLISTTLITSAGGVIEWPVNLPYGDSTVYFWRVSRDSVSPQKAFAWRESSFQTIGNKHGWGQAQFDQFKNNTYQFVNYKKSLRQFIFQNNKHTIRSRNGIAPYPDLSAMNYFFDTNLKEGWSCAFNGWNFAVFDSITGLPQEARSLNYPLTGLGPYNNCCKNGFRYVYAFGTVGDCNFPPTFKTDMENFINSIAPNNYVLAYSTGLTAPNYCQTSSYSNSLYTAFESLGAKNIRTTPDTVAYALFGRKGMSAGQAHVVIGTNKKSILYLEDTITTAWRNGYISSEIIGPSYKWNSLHWSVKSLDNGPGDTTWLKLVGIKANGQADTLKTFKQDSLNVLALYNYIDAKTYPYLKLVAFMFDNVNRSSPQLKRWQVLYDEAPECAINPLKGFASINDTLMEGDEVTFRFPIENIGTKDFNDSLVVTYWIENNQGTKVLLPQKLKSPPFLAGKLLVDTVKVNSYQFKGNNALWIYVNPIQNNRYQPEQSQFNNIGRYPFKVNSDITNPLLDVTFDGVRILNGDIVSAKPSILISLKDENKFLALNDTGAFSIFLQAPNQSTQQRIYFAQGLEFTPANLPKNSASILYNPNLGTDGKYILIVQAKDRSKNVSGTQDYRIQFEVNNKPSVTNVLNYPNPFSTSTRFVFTLTGSEVPEVFTIQIMTITGKIVREITRSELGNLHIGRNITDYAWDARDTYGDRLANGVYLYRVLSKLNGENIEKNGSGADKFITREFGKMVIMR